MEAFLNIIGVAANIIGVVSFLVVLGLFLQARARYRRYVKSREKSLSDRPWALAIGINGGIGGQVQQYLEANNLGHIQIEEYAREGFLPADEYYNVLADLSRIKDRLTTAGVTEVHLFYKGPVSLAMGIGSIFDNWVPVKVYDYPGGVYHLNFVLDKGTVIGLLGTGPGSSLKDVFKT